MSTKLGLSILAVLSGSIPDASDTLLLTVLRQGGTLYVAVPKELAPERAQPRF
jgi:hypothetical protein